ncbi:deoxycytidylate deaminase [Spiroplasma chinense]|uniref:Deoxycytidylate deaminase n=1 Tax=Spiroplasma chinense TaxID=216932 RepID=A0A5B9Y5I7_9MOLU|nr:dCMP deaminase family protein [Spiroplasma chinense]QEH62085.1 deoxycytidylate deaminase [Spiroplasma chinense]
MNCRDNYIDWNTYFMAMVELNAMKSKDPNTQVGAVIVNDLKQIVSTGYNGMPRGFNDNDYPWDREGEWQDTKYPYIVHAELNAILSSGHNVRGCYMYTSLFPCNECSKSLIQSGIKKVYFASDKYNGTIENKVSKKMLDDAGISYEKLAKVELSLKIEK